MKDKELRKDVEEMADYSTQEIKSLNREISDLKIEIKDLKRRLGLGVVSLVTDGLLDLHARHICDLRDELPKTLGDIEKLFELAKILGYEWTTVPEKSEWLKSEN